MRILRDSFCFVYLWTFICFSSIFLFFVAVAIWLVTVCFDRRLVCLHFFTCFWASLYTWFNPFYSVKIDGKEKIEPKHTYVMIANHQSMMDVFSIFRLFVYFKWVAKRSLFAIPCVGWNMTLNDYVTINRRAQNHKMMFTECLRHLLQRRSLFIFPEGTRSKNGRLGIFRAGAFWLASKTKTDILPITIHNSRALSSEKVLIKRGRQKIHIVVHSPLRYEYFKKWDIKTLAEKVRDEIIAPSLSTDCCAAG